MQPHLCFVSNEIFPGTMGGIGKLIGGLAQHLSAAGWRLTFLLAVEPEQAAIFRRHAAAHLPNATVYALDDLLADLAPDEQIPLWGFGFAHYYLSHRVALALQRICARTRVDAVEFNDYLGLGYVALKWRRLWGDAFSGVRMWVRVHGSNEVCQRADDNLSYTREQLHLFAAERYCLRHADAWICPSHGTAAWYRELYGGDTMPTATSAPAFERLGPGRSHPRTLALPQRLLYYGKLQHLKGADTFVRAAVLLCETSDAPIEFELVGHDVTGNGRYVSYQRELARLIPPHWRDRFHFRGRIDARELEQVALACTLAVIPSRVETFCLAAHELNWIGIPIVLNDLPAFRDFFHDRRDCRLYDGTPEGLARVLRELLSQPDPFASWGWTASDVAAHNRDLALYQGLVEQVAPRVPAPPQEAEPLVSIVVPYYNMHAYIDALLASVCASSYRNWELILVDDGSPDPEAQQKLADLERAHADDRFRIVRKANGGLGSARNAGIALARGAYILPLDSDDVIHRDYLARGVQALGRAPDLAAVSCFVSYFRDGDPPETHIDYVIPYDLHPLLITLENRAGVACSLFRREVFEALRYNEELTSYEDWDLWWQLAETGRQAEVMPAILYRYRRRSGSMFNTTGVSQHPYLLASFADRHAGYLRELGPDLFRIYTRVVSELRGENDQLRLALGGAPDLLASKPLQRELRDIRDSKSYRLALFVRRLSRPIRHLRRPTERAIWQAQRTHTVSIEVLGAGNAASQGSEVWLGGLRPPDSSIFALADLRTSGPWSTRAVEHPLVDHMLVATQPGARATATVRGDDFALLFLHHAWSGQVRLSVDGRASDIELYAPEEQSAYREYRWTGAAWQPVGSGMK